MKSTSSVFMDMGDLAAPVGTPSWCLAVREQARNVLTNAKTYREHAISWVEALKEDDHYRTLTDKDGYHFPTWERFCEEPPPYGFGMSVQDLETLIASKPLAQQLAADPEVKPMAEQGEIGNGRVDESRVDNGHSTPSNKLSSNSAERIVRRLKRDAPDVAEALGRGEYPSARAAGKAAGFIRDPTPYELLCRAWNKASHEERDRFMTEKNEQGW